MYFNSGIQIAQRGAVVIDDPLVRAIPPAHRELFFRPQPPSAPFDTVRFLGFFVLDQDAGAVVGQFPHLYPVWIALAYDTLGLTGARYVHGLWAVLGVLAVYFAGAFVLGRRAALAGALLLTVHVAQIWFARYFSAEMLLQPLVFAGALAYARAHVDGDRFFAPVAAMLLALTLFAHLTGIIAIAARWPGRAAGPRRGTARSGLLPAAAGRPDRRGRGLLRAGADTLPADHAGAVAAPSGAGRGAAASVLLLLAGGLWLAGDRPAVSHRLRRWLPLAAAAALPLLAAYALLVREPMRIELQVDPEGLTTFTLFLSDAGRAGRGSGGLADRVPAPLLAGIGAAAGGRRVRRRLLFQSAHHAGSLLGRPALRVDHPAGLSAPRRRGGVHAGHLARPVPATDGGRRVRRAACGQRTACGWRTACGRPWVCC